MAENRPPDRDALNDFWNDLVRASGAQDAVGESLSPETAAVVRRLHALGAAPPPASSRERVRRSLRGTYRQSPNDKESTMHTATNVIHLGLNGRAVPTRPNLLTDRLPRPADHRPLLAAAVLVVAILAGIAGAIIANGLDSNDPRPAPAILAPASPSPDAVTDETLVEVLVPVDLLPPGEPVRAGMAMVTVPVGTSQQTEDEASQNPGILATYILKGTVSVVSDELMHLIEAGGTGTIVEVEAGTEVILQPGDTLVTRKSPGEVWTNDGPAEVQLISMEVFGGPPAASSFPSGWIAVMFDYRDIEAWPADQPTLFRLRLVSALPETVIPPPAEALGQFALHESDETGSSIGQQTDGSIRFVGGGDKPLTAYVLTLKLLGESAATPES